MWEVLDGGHDWAIWRKGFTKYATEILWTNEEEIPGGNTEGGTTTPSVGIHNNATYAVIASVALAGAAYVAFKKKED